MVQLKNQTKNIEKIIFHKLNESRRKRGLKPLKSNKCYAKLSVDHSRIMAHNNYIFHGNNVKKLRICHKQISLDPLWTKDRIYLSGYLVFLIFAYIANNLLGIGLILVSGIIFGINFHIILGALRGHRGNYAGENCAVISTGYVKGFNHEIISDQDIAIALHKILMESPGHRKNILDKNFYRVGIGVFRKGRKFYATELFSD